MLYLRGVTKYYFDDKTEMWTNNKDNHFLIENLVRETTKNCYGYLEL